MAGLGIYHYGARFYSPKLGRFLSADSIVPGYANPQNLNRFSYVTNNPLRYTDPTGHKVACDPYEDDCNGGGSGNGGGNGGGGGDGGGGGGGGGDPHDDDVPDDDGLTARPCTAAQACWTVPDYWDLDPMNADYRSSVYNVYFINVAYTTDRYQQNYLSIGFSFNLKSLLPLGYSYVIGAPGSFFDNKITSVHDINKFLTGPSINLTGGLLAGGGTTLSPGVLIENGYNSDLKPSSMETGLYLPGSLGITGSWGYSAKVSVENGEKR